MGLEEIHPRDAKSPIARLAARQCGLITRGQLLELGLTRGAVARRLANGGLIAAHHGVYWLACPRTEPVSLAAAAVLAGGRHAVLSHGSAAALWEA